MISDFLSSKYVIFLALILGVILSITDNQFRQYAYSLSLTIQQIMLFSVPFIILLFITSSIVTFKGKNITVIVLIYVVICFANFTGIWAVYPVKFIFEQIQCKNSFYDIVLNLSDPLWNFNIQAIFSNEKAILLGFISGLSISRMKNSSNIKLQIDKLSSFAMKKIIVPMIPFFIVGRIGNLNIVGGLLEIFKQYYFLAAAVVLIHITYTFALYALGSNIQSAFQKIRNMFPAMVTAFSSMSSAATFPNTLIGDALTIPVIAFLVSQIYGYPLPGLYEYLIFSLYCVLYKFSTVAIPGGGIIILLPILKKVFSFSDDMSALVMSMYIMLDCFITTTNVMGHGAYGMIFQKVYDKIYGNAHIGNRTTS